MMVWRKSCASKLEEYLLVLFEEITVSLKLSACCLKLLKQLHFYVVLNYLYIDRIRFKVQKLNETRILIFISNYHIGDVVKAVVKRFLNFYRFAR